MPKIKFGEDNLYICKKCEEFHETPTSQEFEIRYYCGSNYMGMVPMILKLPNNEGVFYFADWFEAPSKCEYILEHLLLEEKELERSKLYVGER